MNQVYYSQNLLEEFLLKLKEELKKEFQTCKKIAIKIHFGEPGNERAFKPDQVKPIIDLIKELGVEYFLYDSSVAYPSPRGEPEKHKQIALEKGWDKLGEIRTDDDFTTIKGKNMNYEVCKPLIEADAVLVISHFKGHICSGFGGAVKNLGMGALTKKTKTDIHEGAKPEIVKECSKCKACELACPINGIEVKEKPEFKTCYGCSNCIYACPYNVLKPKINFFDILLAEGASIAQSQFKKVFYINFLINISKECDCEANPKGKIAEDEGYLLGKNPVAIDKAAYDLVTKKAGEDIFLKHNKKSGLEHLKAAEEFNMGSQEYELIKLQ
jgi:hypothetical protein